MKLIYNLQTDPYRNLAIEEYLLRHCEETYLMLWRNRPSVIIGVNQNAFTEIDFDYVERNQIAVVRRQSGGGAVFHDLGNINFTVIRKQAQDNSYENFTRPVIRYLKELGVEAAFSGRNDIVIGQEKISGNAQAYFKDRMMHHGTLLFDSVLQSLAGALKPNPLKIESKGISSVRSRVTNIKKHLPEKNAGFTSDLFFDGLYRYFLNQPGYTPYSFNRADERKIDLLLKNKYATFDWNIARSPKSQISNTAKLTSGIVSLYFSVVNGKITNLKIYGDFFSSKEIPQLEAQLNGVCFQRKEIFQRLSNCHVPDYLIGSNAEELTNLFFQKSI